MGGSQGRPPSGEELETLHLLRGSLDFCPASAERERDELLSRISLAAGAGGGAGGAAGAGARGPWPVPDRRWEALGFQGPDPRKDLRGYQRLALEQLCVLLESSDHGPWARGAALRLSAGLGGDPARILPFCAASIAATELLAMGTGVVPDPAAAEDGASPDGDARPWWALLSSREQYDTAHAVTLRCLVREWMPPRGPGEYMDFSRAREAAKRSLARALRAGPAGVGELAALLGFLGLDGRWAQCRPGGGAPSAALADQEEELVPQIAGQLRYYPAGWAGEISILERALSASARADRRVRWRMLRVCIRAASGGQSGVLDWAQCALEDDGGPAASDALPPCELAGSAPLSPACGAAGGLADGSAAGRGFLTLFMPGGLPPVVLRARGPREAHDWLAALAAAGVAEAVPPGPADGPGAAEGPPAPGGGRRSA